MSISPPVKEWTGGQLHERPTNDERQGAQAEIPNVATEVLNQGARNREDWRNEKREKD